MTRKRKFPITPCLEEALDEIKGLIANRYPEALFGVGKGEDPDGLYLTVTVDVEDMGEVVNTFLDRLVELQVEEELPIFVVPIRPLERNLAILTRQQSPSAVLSSS